MTGLGPFLFVAKKQLERRLAVVWALHGTVVGGALATGTGLVSRRRPLDPEWQFLLVSALTGLTVATVGWFRARPSMTEVAIISDRRLGGRERLATALELSEADGSLVPRQRSDAEQWIKSADPKRVVAGGPPRRALVAAIIALSLASLLAFMSNPALARHRSGQAAEKVREATADQVAALAEKAESGGEAGEDPARRQALVRELRRAEESIRKSDDTEGAVAALAQAQDALRDLGASSGSGRANAATGAGGALSRAAAGKSAGEALGAAGVGSGNELAEMAELVSGLTPDDQKALSAVLAAAAAASTDPALAEKMKEAADELRAGRTDEAKQALSDAAKAQRQQDAARAAQELRALGDALPSLPPDQQADLAAALEAAAVAAGDDPALSDQLSRAGTALREGRASDASKALSAAGDRTESLPGEAELDEQVAAAENDLEEEKERLLSQACAQVSFSFDGSSSTASSTSGSKDDALCGDEAGDQQGEQPESGQPQSGSEGDGAKGDEGASKKGGAGTSEGDGSGSGVGEGKGKGPGSSTEGGGGTFGASGPLAGPPGGPSEEVFIPGVSGPGRTVRSEGGEPGQGSDVALMPYESVYSEYQASALSQADRQAIPERVRALLLRYFQDER